MKANAIFVDSDISPIKGGKKAPPTMAMTIIDPPIFVWTPSPLILSAKLVGYISDIKKLVKNIVQTPIHPG